MKHNPLSPPQLSKAGDRQSWGELHGSATAMVIARSALAHTSSTVVIAPNMAAADRLANDIEIFLHDCANAPQVMLFPDWETLPYDSFSPHQDIISGRMRCLYQLARNERLLTVVSAQTLMQRLAPQSYILAKSLVLSLGESLEQEKFRKQLVFAADRPPSAELLLYPSIQSQR